MADSPISRPSLDFSSQNLTSGILSQQAVDDEWSQAPSELMGGGMSQLDADAGLTESQLECLGELASS
ncbi:hypothetical protein TeGR_g3293 [Tetraparma gracilis]|uniref:Uncharacterized protein n=1 Tax=Tetraparma gracilis TaxID=2962635 RepID=A0ABQ6M7Z1_9STRA|nr:hypothetical protein TeGR_g3293 [Tetraparma gracilis]